MQGLVFDEIGAEMICLLIVNCTQRQLLCLSFDSKPTDQKITTRQQSPKPNGRIVEIFPIWTISLNPSAPPTTFLEIQHPGLSFGMMFLMHLQHPSHIYTTIYILSDIHCNNGIRESLQMYYSIGVKKMFMFVFVFGEL